MGMAGSKMRFGCLGDGVGAKGRRNLVDTRYWRRDAFVLAASLETDPIATEDASRSIPMQSFFSLDAIITIPPSRTTRTSLQINHSRRWLH